LRQNRAVENEDRERNERGIDVSDEKRDPIAENKRLSEEAKNALLAEIIAAAPNAGTGQIEPLARAYTLVVGAKWGHLPGEHPGS
jgi:hypothetical protein